ncbi:MAG: hypothetical protein MUP09_11470, partial [Thiovulaceae bacterium]|nr:hypothetical protein [Sulfurimonadaceae bacterium]
MFNAMSSLPLYLVLTFAWLYILMHAVRQYRVAKNSPLLIRSIYLIIALFSLRFFSVYAINSLRSASDQALLPEKFVMLFDSFYHPMVLDVIDTIVTFAILVIIMLGLFGRQRVQLQNELDQFLRLKFDVKRLEENVHRHNAHIALLGI